MQILRVMFEGQSVDAEPGGAVRFGRGSGPGDVDVVLDPADRELSSVAGAFVHVDGAWSVQNVSRRPHVRLSVDGVEVPAHTQRDLEPPTLRLRGSSTVLVHVGMERETARVYRIEARLAPRPGRAEPPESGTETPPRQWERAGAVVVTRLEHLVLVALCAPSLEDGDYAPVTDREIAQRLTDAGHGEPSRVAVSRRLDSIREKLRQSGELEPYDLAAGIARSRPAIVRWALTVGPAVYGPVTADDVARVFAG